MGRSYGLATENTPQITIGVTCFNAEETVSRALSSALGQDWPDIEVLVVDDCSSDNSVAIVEELMRSDSRVRLIRQQENRGVAVARNSLIENARGEFVAFFDDDDESSPARLTKQYEAIVSCEQITGAELVICHSARLQILPDGREHYEATMVGADSERVPNGEEVAQAILFGRQLSARKGAMATCSQMARKSTYLRVGCFDEVLRRSEDTDLNVRLALAGGYFFGLEEPLVRQTMTISAEKSLRDEQRFAQAWLARHKAYLSKIGWWRHTSKWLDLKFAYLRRDYTAFATLFAELLLLHPVKTVQRVLWALPNSQYNRQKARYSQKYLSG